MTGVLITREDRNTQGEDDHVRAQAETRGITHKPSGARTAGKHGKLAEAKKESPLWILEGAWLY